MPKFVIIDAYKIELLGDMSISTTFNVRDLTPYIEDEDKGIEDLRANPLQKAKVDVEEATQSNLLNHIKTLVCIKPMILMSVGSKGLFFLSLY